MAVVEATLFAVPRVDLPATAGLADVLAGVFKAARFTRAFPEVPEAILDLDRVDFFFETAARAGASLAGMRMSSPSRGASKNSRLRRAFTLRMESAVVE